MIATGKLQSWKYYSFKWKKETNGEKWSNKKSGLPQIQN